jgi:hypothetical protein
MKSTTTVAYSQEWKLVRKSFVTLNPADLIEIMTVCLTLLFTPAKLLFDIKIKH